MANRNVNNLINNYREQGVPENKIKALQELSGMIKIISLFGNNAKIVGYSFKSYNAKEDLELFDKNTIYDNNEDYNIRLFLTVDGQDVSMSFSTNKTLNDSRSLPLIPLEYLSKINSLDMAGLKDLQSFVSEYIELKGYKFEAPGNYISRKFDVNGDIGAKLVRETFISMFKGSSDFCNDANYSEIANNLFELIDYDKQFVGTRARLFRDIPATLEGEIEMVSFGASAEDAEMVESIIKATREDVVEELDVTNLMDSED